MSMILATPLRLSNKMNIRMEEKPTNENPENAKPNQVHLGQKNVVNKKKRNKNEMIIAHLRLDSITSRDIVLGSMRKQSKLNKI